MRRTFAVAAATALAGMLMLSVDAFAARPPGVGGGGGGGGGGGETGANNLSFPLIMSDNASPGTFPQDGAWRWASITSTDQCIDEFGVAEGTPVPADILCYYGRHTTTNSETGAIEFDGEPMVWWLQKRTANFWKTLSVGHDTSTPLVVTAVDVGDLLESTPSIATRQIRVEFNLLQSVPADDDELGEFVVTDWADSVPAPCVLPTEAGQSLGCFAAVGMSGAVPGTQQSGNEIQGADFGPGPDPGQLTGTVTLLNPTLVRTTVPDVGGINALVYSNCARLVIQKVPDSLSPVWDKTTGVWSGPSVGAPLVNIAHYTNAWTTEITSGGSIVYGYNWNAKTVATGTYRLTMVLDGNDSEGPVCGSTLATEFAAPTEGTAGTQLVNLGENFFPNILYKGSSDLGDEGGLVYIDIPITAKGGGGGKK